MIYLKCTQEIGATTMAKIEVDYYPSTWKAVWLFPAHRAIAFGNKIQLWEWTWNFDDYDEDEFLHKKSA